MNMSIDRAYRIDERQQSGNSVAGINGRLWATADWPQLVVGGRLAGDTEPMNSAVAPTVAVLLILASCSKEPGSASLDKWVTASCLKPPTVAYTPKPIISAREQSPGRWVWLPEKAEAKALSLDGMLGGLANAKILSPEPLVLFTFSHHEDRLELIKLKSRIADAMGALASAHVSKAPRINFGRLNHRPLLGGNGLAAFGVRFPIGYGPMWVGSGRLAYRAGRSFPLKE